jgi:hypothetical protein
VDIQQRLKDIAISESGFVFDPFTGATFSVNATGKLILLKLREGFSPDQLDAALRDAFELFEDDDPSRDVHEFLGLLREQGVLPREPAHSSPADAQLAGR